MSRPRLPLGAAAVRGLRRGLSLVELMVGVVVGLFVVAAATVMVTGQLAENRRLLLETQMQQDLRAAADIITRELRRSGAWGASWNGIWGPGGPAGNNAFHALDLASASNVGFYYQRTATQFGQWRFRLDGDVIKTELGVGVAAQDLTDANVMRVTAFNVALTTTPGIRVPCPKMCAGGDVDCWPQTAIREFTVTITAESKADPTIQRTVVSSARVRNDWVQFAGSPPAACPS